MRLKWNCSKVILFQLRRKYCFHTVDYPLQRLSVHNIFRIPALMRRSVIFSSISLRTIISQKSEECAGCCGKVFWKLLFPNIAEKNPAWLNDKTCKDAEIFMNIFILKSKGGINFQFEIWPKAKKGNKVLEAAQSVVKTFMDLDLGLLKGLGMTQD